jgi:hypothetical protein
VSEHFSLDVVVVTYKCPEDVDALKRDLPVMTKMPYELHLHDNSSNGNTLTQLWNSLARRGDGGFIAFLNTDIRISPCWDSRLADALIAHPELGAVMPRPVGHDWPNSADPSKPAFPLSMSIIPAPSPEAMTTIAAGVESDNSLHPFPNCNAAFFAVMVRRKDWEALNGFDERLRFYGQDHDFQRRLRKRFNMITAKVNNSAVWHRCAGSVRQGAGHVNFNAEMHHCGKTAGGIVCGALKEWDLLSDEERVKIGKDPLYSVMPLYR